MSLDLPTMIAKAQMDPGWWNGLAQYNPLPGQVFPGNPQAQEFNYMEAAPPGTALAAGAGVPLGLMIAGIKPLTMPQIYKNLANSGIEVRDYPIGHMISPEGKGVAPLSNRGISNHWEVAVDAGYLPESQLKSLSHSPANIVSGLLEKGWLRNRSSGGYPNFESWGLPKKHINWIEESISRYADNPKKTAYIDDAKNGISYNFKLQDFIDNNMNLQKTLRTAEKQKFAPAIPLDLDKTREMYIKEGQLKE